MTGTFPLPTHPNKKLCCKFWIERYLYWVRKDGVCPERDDYFFKCLKKGRFRSQRWGYKRYSALMKLVARFNGYSGKEHSGLFFFWSKIGVLVFWLGHSGRVSSASILNAAGAHQADLTHHGQWSGPKIANHYVANDWQSKLRRAAMIQGTHVDNFGVFLEF